MLPISPGKVVLPGISTKLMDKDWLSVIGYRQVVIDKTHSISISAYQHIKQSADHDSFRQISMEPFPSLRCAPASEGERIR